MCHRAQFRPPGKGCDAKHDDPGGHAQLFDCLEQIEIRECPAHHVDIGARGGDADGQPQCRPQEPDQNDLANHQAHDLATCRANGAEDTELGAASQERGLQRSMDEENAHGEANHAQGRQVQAEGREEPGGFLGALVRSQNASPLAQRLTDSRRGREDVGTVRKVDGNFVEAGR